MRKDTYIEYGNYHCTFGDHVLLDFFREIVYPAFTNPFLGRSVFRANYRLHDVELLNLGSETTPVLVIAGRIIKNTSVLIEQTFDEEKRRIVKEGKSYPIALSSLFLLRLNDHRLIYVPETANAPGMEAFKNTTQYLMKQIRDVVVQERYLERRAASDTPNKVTKVSIAREIPPPHIDLIPLGDGETLNDLLQRYQTLQTINVRLVRTNHEINPDGFWEQVQESSEDLNSNKTTLNYVNKDGLNKEQATQQLKPVIEQGLYDVSFNGVDQNGADYEVVKDQFRVRQAYNIESEKVADNVVPMHEAYKAALSSKQVKEPNQTHDNRSLLQRIKDLFRTVA